MNDASLLNVGAESDGDLVEIAAEDGAGPDGGAVADGDLAGQDYVRRHVGVDGDLGEPLPQRDDLPLTSVVPFHPILRRPNGLRRLRGERALEEALLRRRRAGG